MLAVSQHQYFEQLQQPMSQDFDLQMIETFRAKQNIYEAQADINTNETDFSEMIKHLPSFNEHHSYFLTNYITYLNRIDLLMLRKDHVLHSFRKSIYKKG